MNSADAFFATTQDLMIPTDGGIPHVDPYDGVPLMPSPPCIEVASCMTRLRNLQGVGALEGLPTTNYGALEFLPPEVFQSAYGGSLRDPYVSGLDFVGGKVDDLQQAQAELQQAQSDLANAQSQLDAANQQFQNDADAGNDLTDDVTAQTQALDDVATASAAVQAAQQTVDEVSARPDDPSPAPAPSPSPGPVPFHPAPAPAPIPPQHTMPAPVPAPAAKKKTPWLWYAAGAGVGALVFHKYHRQMGF